MNLKVLLIVSLSLFTLNAADRGYGDPLETYPDLPNWQERAIETLTNACRMDPEGYRDEYIGSYSILLPNNYPAVNPLYWFVDLNRSARAHGIDMANNCGMQHESCNGDSFHVRVRSYYTKSYTIGENIATGRPQPQETMRQWLMDGNPPAADLSRAAGHRTNIMNSRYKEMGAGYAYGSVKYNHFWVQDFGGGKPIIAYPISGGSHIFTSGDSIRFLVNYYDSLGRAPTGASVVIDGQKFDLQLHLGSSGKGTFMRAEMCSKDCRNYYFLITDAGGKEWRYPQYGTLVTYGEGDCKKSYLSQDELPVENRYSRPVYSGTGLIGQNTVLVDLCGRIVNRRIVNRRPGVYIVHPAGFSNSTVRRVIITTP